MAASIVLIVLGDSDALRVGDPALAVGNPFGLGVVDQSPTYTLGVISALHYLQGRYAECVVTDAEVNPGNSGGPLVNLAGQVVGINGQISTRWGLRSNTGLGFAISTRQIRMWLPRLEAAQGEEVKHGRISGMELQEAAGDTPQSVIVKDVGEGTPAGVGGFQKGDAIVRIDGLAARNAFRLASLIGIYPDGHEATFEVRRDGKGLPLKVQLVAARQASSRTIFSSPSLITGNRVVIAMENPDYLPARDTIRRLIPGIEFEYCVALKEDIFKMIDLFFDVKRSNLMEDAGSIEDILGQLEPSEEEGAEEADKVSEEDSAIVQLVNKMIIHAYNRNASDIHIEPRHGKNNAHIRIRVDGACQLYQTVPFSYKRAIVSRIKIMSDLDIAERRLLRTEKSSSGSMRRWTLSCV